uniref:Uncharacterized protein n=1 Tax=Arundo donax TaxID=35708 RepID=A0A0A9BM84_ARUDO
MQRICTRTSPSWMTAVEQWCSSGTRTMPRPTGSLILLPGVFTCPGT